LSYVMWTLFQHQEMSAGKYTAPISVVYLGTVSKQGTYL